MKTRQRNTRLDRRGKVLVLIALLTPAIMGFMALSVDLGIIAAVDAELQTVTDASALAGAMQLASEARVRGAGSTSTRTSSALTLDAAIANAQTVATYVGQKNPVLNQTPIFFNNTANSSSGDIVIGYVDPKTRTWNPPPLADNSKMNAVLVNASRSTSHGGVVPGFFSRAFNYGGTTAQKYSIAMAQNYPVLAVQTYKSQNVHLLPIVLDVTTYKQMMAGTTTDEYTYDPDTNTISTGPDNVYESKLYPVASGSPGNWGTINVGVTNNSTEILEQQIMYGISPSQLATFPNGQIALQPPTVPGDPPSITFSGNPGISAALKSALDSIIGDPVIVPIYDQSGSNGNNAWYRVIAFQPARILSVDFQGAAKYVIIQPCLIRSPSIVPMTDTSQWPSNWSWKSGGVVRVHLMH